MMHSSMMAVVVISRKTWMMRVMRMVWVMWINRIIWISRIIRIRPVAAKVKTWITPIIWSVAVIRIPVRIPSVIIWPSEAKAETCSNLKGYACFGSFFNNIYGVDNALNAVCYSIFLVHFTLF